MPKKTAIVTGASTGLGRAIACRLAREDYHVFVTYLNNLAEAENTCTAIRDEGYECTPIQVDVADPISVEKLQQAFERKYQVLDVLVNNAGADIPKSIEAASFEDWTKVLRIKTDGPFLMVKTFLPHLQKSSNANVVNITSHEGESPNPAYLAYGVATAALIAITKGLAKALPKKGIRVNAVSPGEVRTPLWQKTGEDSDELWVELAKKNPMGRVATTGDVAEAVWLLISDKFRFLNGVIFYVNGGSHLL